MSYVNQTPTRETVVTLGSRYSYEEITTAIEEANAVNAEYDATYQAVWTSVAAKLSSTDFIDMSLEDRKLYGDFVAVNGNWCLEAVTCKGATKSTGTEFWPVARVQKDIKTLRRQIKNLRKFEKSL